MQGHLGGIVLVALSGKLLLLLILVSRGFPPGRAPQMRVWVWTHVLALARCVWLLVKMSVVVSMSMKQSSSFESLVHLIWEYPVAGSW